MFMNLNDFKMTTLLNIQQVLEWLHALHQRAGLGPGGPKRRCPSNTREELKTGAMTYLCDCVSTESPKSKHFWVSIGQHEKLLHRVVVYWPIVHVTERWQGYWTKYVSTIWTERLQVNAID